MKKKIQNLSLIFALMFSEVDAGETVIIGHNNVPKMDIATIQKIYKGKFINVAGVNIKPVAIKAGSPIRSMFLENYLEQNEEKYVRLIGTHQNSPPKIHNAACRAKLCTQNSSTFS